MRQRTIGHPALPRCQSRNPHNMWHRRSDSKKPLFGDPARRDRSPPLAPSRRPARCLNKEVRMPRRGPRFWPATAWGQTEGSNNEPRLLRARPCVGTRRPSRGNRLRRQDHILNSSSPGRWEESIVPPRGSFALEALFARSEGDDARDISAHEGKKNRRYPCGILPRPDSRRRLTKQNRMRQGV